MGSFEGVTGAGAEISGRMVGRLTGVTGALEVLITSEALEDNFDGEGVVDEDGNVMSAGRFIQDGTFDFDDCTASGTWEFGPVGSGTWRLELPDAAL